LNESLLAIDSASGFFSMKLVNLTIVPRRELRDLWAKMWRFRGLAYRTSYSEPEVTSLLAGTKLFFILGTGRSGTQMLSGLLNKSKGALVVHEPNRHEDRNLYTEIRQNSDLAVAYLNEFRKYGIYKRIMAFRPQIYGEVTGTLRYHCAALKEVFPHVRLFLLVRDGRDVVRSVMSMKRFYKKGSKKFHRLGPLEGDRYHEQWHAMSRFEKICWAWADTNRVLLEIIPDDVIHFEQIINDYDYTKNRLFDPLELSISFEQWRESVKHKSPNATKVHTFPHWRDWRTREEESFDEICGQMMIELRYEYNIRSSSPSVS
jgi:hypothetical protein